MELISSLLRLGFPLFAAKADTPTDPSLFHINYIALYYLKLGMYRHCQYRDYDRVDDRTVNEWEAVDGIRIGSVDRIRRRKSPLPQYKFLHHESPIS
jgi:hypothetical protein